MFSLSLLRRINNTTRTITMAIHTSVPTMPPATLDPWCDSLFRHFPASSLPSLQSLIPSQCKDLGRQFVLCLHVNSSGAHVAGMFGKPRDPSIRQSGENMTSSMAISPVYESPTTPREIMNKYDKKLYTVRKKRINYVVS